MQHRTFKIIGRLSAVILAGYFMVSIIAGFFHNKQILGRYAEALKRYGAVIQRNQELKTKLEYVQSDTFIEVTARDKLGLVKPGEVAYKIVEED
jgi:cell division protein FtsB